MAITKQGVNTAVGKVLSLIFPLQGQFTASITGKLKFQAPQGMAILGVSAVARAKGGTQGTSTIDVLAAGTSVLTGAIDISGTAGTIVAGVLTTAPTKVAKDTAIQVNLVVSGGSSPTLDDITLQIDYLPIDF